MTERTIEAALAEKEIHIISQPDFEEFAARIGSHEHVLFDQILEAILTRHHEAIRYAARSRAQEIWQLQTDLLIFRYQLLPFDIEVSGIESRVAEPPLSVSADFLDDFSSIPSSLCPSDRRSRFWR